MVSKPSILPQWAESDVVDPISGQNNVLEPPTEKQDEGWDRLEFPPRQWFNWLARYTYRWLSWFNQQEEQSRVIANTDVIADVVTGGMCIIYAIDTAVPANFYHGIAYIPPSPGGPITVTEIDSSTLTVSTINVAGEITVSSGTGPYIVYGQMKTIP